MSKASQRFNRKQRFRSANAEKNVVVASAELGSPAIPYDPQLLERSRTQWQFGDWYSLAQLDHDTLQHHPDRAKLALLVAAGRLQIGQDAEAKQYIRLAQDWGISKKLISQILIAGVHNSIGRAAAIGNSPHRALSHFKSAISISNLGSATELSINARTTHELNTIGLLPSSQGRLQQLQALARLAKQSANTLIPAASPTSEVHAFYIQLGKTQEREPIPFLLIDSKSLPRSGLHYLKRNLSKVFGEHFSFCEWYQEPGCCKKMPCALTGFATHTQETRQLRIRLAKSHDFELTDPVYQTNSTLRRLILVRDPLYILTSWFALAQLDTHKAILAKNGINIKKIWIAHEKEVLNSAYRLLNDHFKPPTLLELTDWLEKKSQYIANFMEKWVKPVIEQPESNFEVVHYENINRYIANLIDEFRPYVSDIATKSIDEVTIKARQQFKKREDPFCVPFENLSYYIQSNSLLFTEISKKINNLETFRYLMKNTSITK